MDKPEIPKIGIREMAVLVGLMIGFYFLGFGAGHQSRFLSGAVFVAVIGAFGILVVAYVGQVNLNIFWRWSRKFPPKPRG